MPILLTIILLAALGYLLFRMNAKRGPSKYDRKPSTPWDSLSEGEDPTL